MAQPSVAHYFNTRKRPASDYISNKQVKKAIICPTELKQRKELNKVESAVKIDGKVFSGDKAEEFINNASSVEQQQIKDAKHALAKRICLRNRLSNLPKTPRKVEQHSKHKQNDDLHQPNINDFISKMAKKQEVPVDSKHWDSKGVQPSEQSKSDKLEDIKKKICSSSRLKDLKASMARFNESAKKLQEVEKKTAEIVSPRLKTFRSIQVEVPVSPKVFSPEKPYLSPKKVDITRRNLFGEASPTKNAVSLSFSPSKIIQESLSKSSLTLPYKYRLLAEIFRAIDTVCQILYNRKETITFRKLKPAVEELTKKNISLKHLSQIKSFYPNAFTFEQKKLRAYGMGKKDDQWELILNPVTEAETMNPECLLERRRKFYKILLDKVKEYHEEFLLSLDPPMRIPKDQIKHWHAEFDVEKIPDVEESELPHPPCEEKYTTGKEVLEKAKQLIGCNSRMEQALERLRAAREVNQVSEEEKPKVVTSVLKGIPPALLERVRQKQAAKALLSMTRSASQEKEVLLYSRLPEIAKLTRNVFVTEKKSVLPLEILLDKLEHCYRCHLTKSEMETHLRTISKEVEGWLTILEVRGVQYAKLVKNADLSIVVDKLETLAKRKNES